MSDRGPSGPSGPTCRWRWGSGDVGKRESSCWRPPRLPAGYSTPELARAPDPSALHDPLHRIQIVDVGQGLLAEKYQVGVMHELDGSRPLGAFTTYSTGRVAGGRKQGRGGRQGYGIHKQAQPSEQRRPLVG